MAAPHPHQLVSAAWRRPFYEWVKNRARNTKAEDVIDFFWKAYEVIVNSRRSSPTHRRIPGDPIPIPRATATPTSRASRLRRSWALPALAFTCFTLSGGSVAVAVAAATVEAAATAEAAATTTVAEGEAAAAEGMVAEAEEAAVGVDLAMADGMVAEEEGEEAAAAAVGGLVGHGGGLSPEQEARGLAMLLLAAPPRSFKETFDPAQKNWTRESLNGGENVLRRTDRLSWDCAPPGVDD
uniref:Uncharacterized protein n=1 Tax=Oryza punctata TaxID=4537 RepID=A0A0E0JNJ7_ORYPU